MAPTGGGDIEEGTHGESLVIEASDRQSGQFADYQRWSHPSNQKALRKDPAAKMATVIVMPNLNGERDTWVGSPANPIAPTSKESANTCGNRQCHFVVES